MKKKGPDGKLMYLAALKNYNRSFFHMSVTAAHEIIHLYISYMGGSPRPGTPPDMTFWPFGDEIRGESGHWWEGEVFGGLIGFWEDPNSPLNNRQAGIPFRADDKGLHRQVDLKFLLGIIDPSKFLA